MALADGERTCQTKDGQFEFFIKYADGKKKVPSRELLETHYPERFSVIKNLQLEQFKVKLTKGDLDIAFADIDNKKDRTALIETCMLEFDTKPEYHLRLKKGDA